MSRCGLAAAAIAGLALAAAAQQVPQPAAEKVVRTLGGLAGTCRYRLEVTSLRGLRPESCAQPRALAMLRQAALQPVGATPLASFAELERAFEQLAAVGAKRVAYRAAVTPAVRMHARTGLDHVDIPVVLKTRHYDLVYDTAASMLDSRRHAHVPEVYELQAVLKPIPLLPASLELWLRSDWRALDADRVADGERLQTFVIRHPQVPEFELCTAATTHLPVACWFRQEQNAVTHGRFVFAATAQPWPQRSLQISCANGGTDLERFVISAFEAMAGPDDFRFGVAPGTALRDSRASPALDLGNDVTAWPAEFGQWLENPRDRGWRPTLATVCLVLLAAGVLLALRWCRTGR